MTPKDKAEAWQLATDSGLPELPPPPPAPTINRSAERLDRALHILTAEHCGWMLVFAYAVFTRLALLTLRPLDAGEAARALDLLGRYEGTSQPGWIRLLTLGLFAIGGPSDWSLRLVPAISGLLLIVIAYAMRRYLGRAGGLALAMLLVLSPGFTYYSRTYASAAPAALIALLTLYAFCAVIERPSPVRAGWLGAAAGLMIATPPDGRLTGISFLLVLSLLGLYRLAVNRHALLSIRVWFNRYRRLLLIAVVTAVAIGFVVQLFGSGGKSATPTSAPSSADNYLVSPRTVAQFYLPALTLDELLIVLAAIAALIAVIGLRLRTQFAAAIVLWTLTSLVLAAFSLPPNIAYLPIVLLPMAVLGALGIEWLHHLSIWTSARIVVGVLAILTFYIQIVSTFVFYAPDASEPAWNRHASLYWPPLSTTVQTSIYCRRAMAGIMPEDGTVYFRVDPPAIRWYLRDLRPVNDAGIASVIVGPPGRGSQPSQGSGLRRYDFDYAMSWPLSSNDLTFGAALRYIGASEAWASPMPASVSITARASALPETGSDSLGD